MMTEVVVNVPQYEAQDIAARLERERERERT